MMWLRKHGFVLAAAFLFAVIAGNGLIAYLELGAVIDRFRASRHSSNVLEELNETLGALRNAETGQRGYLLTGRAAYLQPYHDGRANVTHHLEQLRILAAADPIRGRRVLILRQAVEAKLNELDATVTRYRSDGPQAALRMVLTDQGNDLMMRIRSLASNWTNQEQRTRAIHRALATAGSERAALMIALTSVIAAVLLLVTLSQI